MILSAGIIIVRAAAGRHLFLFLRAYSYWDFPKGEVEPGETPFATALREAKEETGLTGLRFPWGRVFRETEPYNNGRKKARYYLAETKQSSVILPVNPEIGMPEHHEYRWLDAQGLKQLAPGRLVPVIEWAEQVIAGGKP